MTCLSKRSITQSNAPSLILPLNTFVKSNFYFIIISHPVEYHVNKYTSQHLMGLSYFFNVLNRQKRDMA